MTASTDAEPARRPGTALPLLLLACAVLAACDRAPPAGASSTMTVSAAWSRATAPGASVGVVYLDLTNATQRNDRLVAASTTAAPQVEVHETSMHQGMMSMQKLSGLDLPAGRTQHLAPEGRHLMLTGLAAPLVEGTTLPLTLRFEHAAPLTVSVAVLGIGATAPP